MDTIIKKSSNGTHYILINEDLVKSFDTRRVICTMNTRAKFHCAFNFSKNEGHYIYVNRKLIDKLKLDAGDAVTVTFKKDDSKYQFELPEEFEEVLKTDEYANKVFQSLTPGNQRGIIHLIAKIKSSQKRIEKSLLFAEKLKMRITSPREITKR